MENKVPIEKMNTPFFSIILPTYNRAHFLPKAIQSVINQSFTDWELIIVDDGSTDNTSELVESYCKKDKRIRYIYQENEERSAARNKGIELAKGEFICFLDSDDYYLDEKLANLIKSIDETKDSSHTLFYDGLIFENERELKTVTIPLKGDHETIFEFILQNPIGPLQVCGAKKLFKKYSFNQKLRIGEDVELWLRMATEFNFISVDSYQTIATEHYDRSVNLRKYNSAKEQLKQLEIIFDLHDEHKISIGVRKKLLSDCFFNSAKHFMMNGKKIQAIFQLLKSIFKDPRNMQTKHRTYCLSKLLIGQIPKEYLKQ
jgi:glycosyltransferase involved in cell wall biosynthesis